MKNPMLLPEHIQALERIWRRSTKAGKSAASTWQEDLKQLYDLGIGMQEMLQFLYGQQPGLEAFLQWANDNSIQSAGSKSLEKPVLSEADLAQWKEYEYVVLKEAVSKEEQEAAGQAIWEFLGADPQDEESWYRQHPAKNGLMVTFTQHEALRATRNSPRIRKAYEQLYSTTSIYKTIDKVSFNPPQTDTYRFMGSPLHWDTSLQFPIPERFQGLLYLSDVTAAGGAFRCVPGFHRHIEQWAAALPADTDLRKYALETLQSVPVPGSAGDFVIWHQALPHCASPNLDKQPRLVQYLTYLPNDSEDDRNWI